MSEADCIFCRIVRGEIDAEVVHDEDDVLAFEDINSKAPVHVLVIPRQHVANLEEIGALPDTIVKRLFEVASEVARWASLDAWSSRCIAAGLYTPDIYKQTTS
jgi:histidine triad (HIT) family protein